MQRPRKSRPTSEVLELDLYVQSGWVRALDMYLNDALIEAEKFKLKTNQTFEHGVMQNIFLLIV